MRPLNVIFGIVVVLGLAILLAWTDEKRKVVKISVWTGAIFLVLLVRAFLPDDIGPASWADVADLIIPDGYSQHSVETSISIDEDWIVGETKECASTALDFRLAKQAGKEPGYVAAWIDCGHAPEHMVKVNLYGRLNQPEHGIIHWHCTRDPEAFTCRQTGAE